jgi:hypothetical protein
MSMGFTALAARTRYWHGRLVENAAPDRRLLRLGEAQNIAAQLGMVLLQQQARELLDQLTLRL